MSSDETLSPPMSYNRKGDRVGCFLFCVPIGLCIFGGVYQQWHWTGVGVCAGALVVGPLVYIRINLWVEQFDQYCQRIKRCMHGVKGAAHDYRLCPVCHAEALAREMDRACAREQVAAKELARETVNRAQKAAEQAERYREWVHSVRLPGYIKQMDPRDFEGLVCGLFSRLGYAVERTPYSGDHGSDGYLTRDGVRTVLQCKRVQRSVGEPILRNVYGTMHASGCSAAIVVTTGTVSRQALKWIRTMPIRIIELEELEKMVRENFHEDDVVPIDYCPNLALAPYAGIARRTRGDSADTKQRARGVATFPSTRGICPQCGSALRFVNGRNGPFMGCTGYPACRFTQSL